MQIDGYEKDLYLRKETFNVSSLVIHGSYSNISKQMETNFAYELWKKAVICRAKCKKNNYRTKSKLVCFIYIWIKFDEIKLENSSHLM